MITVTEKAVSELKALLEAKDAPAGSGLRLGVERGGCAGLAYVMRIATPEEGDKIIDLSGTRFIVANDSFDVLTGCTVDLTENGRSHVRKKVTDTYLVFRMGG